MNCARIFLPGKFERENLQKAVEKIQLKLALSNFYSCKCTLLILGSQKFALSIFQPTNFTNTSRKKSQKFVNQTRDNIAKFVNQLWDIAKFMNCTREEKVVNFISWLFEKNRETLQLVAGKNPEILVSGKNPIIAMKNITNHVYRSWETIPKCIILSVTRKNLEIFAL